MSKEEILQAGIAAVRSGERERAAALFAQVVKTDPSWDEGWYWLGVCCFAPDQREYCFRRVLALNPNHLKAKQQLERLSAPAPAPPPVQPFHPAPTETKGSREPSKPITPHVSPFINDEERAPVVEEPPPPAVPALPKVDPAKTPGPQPVKPKKSPILLLLSIPTVIICGLTFAGLIFSGRLAGWLPASFTALLTPVRIPTQVSFLTSLPPTLSPTSTPPTVIPSPRPTASYTPLFENAQCPIDVPAGANVNCGFLIVPEDRTGDPSHTIRLAVAVYHSTSRNPAPDPVIFLQGGPGGEAVQLSANAYDFLVAPFLSKRDFIVYDQRGTGLSEPALECDELTKIYLDDIHGLIPASTRNLVYSNAFLSCNGLMSVQGVNLNAYTTVASAADVKDLLAVLGYQKADLYGASYGTRLAQVIMRDYPGMVNSAILDSVVPVESSLFGKYPDTVESALRTLFDGCAAEPKCHAAYPELETVFWDLVHQLDDNPITVTTSHLRTGTITESVDGSVFMDIILGSIKQSGLIATAPQSIYRFKSGDYSTIIAAQYSLPFAFEGISPGLYISVMCHEHVLTTTLADLQAANAGRQNSRDYVWLPFYGKTEDVFKTCKSWGATGPWLGENDPVVSDIPALIITGRYDPTTPPMYGQQIAAHLSHSYYFEFPDQGHTPTAADSTGCAMDIALAFLDNPGVEPDRSCLDEEKKIGFLVPYTGSPALQMETVDVAGITAKVPEDWYSLGEGIYWRGNSPFDVAEVDIFQAYVTAAELEDWLSSAAYGFRGLDSAPIQAGQRQSNDLTWTLYTSSSDGRPVDIAMADYRGTSLLMLLFSNGDEHEAFYRTVFLPMVDSAQP